MGTIVLDLISLNYSETLSAAAGHSVEEAKAQTIAAGNYIDRKSTRLNSSH